MTKKKTTKKKSGDRYSPPTAQQLAVLRAFAKSAGTNWKSQLLRDWAYDRSQMIDRDAFSVLRGLGGTHGTQWLLAFEWDNPSPKKAAKRKHSPQAAAEYARFKREIERWGGDHIKGMVYSLDPEVETIARAELARRAAQKKKAPENGPSAATAARERAIRDTFKI